MVGLTTTKKKNYKKFGELIFICIFVPVTLIIKQMEKMIATLNFELEGRKFRTKETTIEHRVFETNYRNNQWIEHLTHILNNMNYHKALIGKNVWKKKNNHHYITLKEYSETYDDFMQKMNPLSHEVESFSKELFDAYVVDEINQKIDYYTSDLLERGLTCSSTNKFNNLIYEWGIEEKQLIIKFLKQKVLLNL